MKQIASLDRMGLRIEELLGSRSGPPEQLGQTCTLGTRVVDSSRISVWFWHGPTSRRGVRRGHNDLGEIGAHFNALDTTR